MDGFLSLLLLAVPSQSMLGHFVDLGVLVAAVLLAVLSALALVRQLLSAIWSRS